MSIKSIEPLQNNLITIFPQDKKGGKNNENFRVDYDYENDDLLVYKEGVKSKKTLDLDDILIDFDENGDVVGIEILNALKLFNVDKYDLPKNLIKFEVIGKLQRI